MRSVDAPGGHQSRFQEVLEDQGDLWALVDPLQDHPEN